MAILEEENRTLRKRVQELELTLQRLKQSHAHIVEENAQLKEQMRSLEQERDPTVEGRAHPRIETAFRVDSMNARGDIALGVGRNISLGGAFIETDLQSLPGETMTITFDLLDQPFKLLAEVVRATTTGFGVKFSIDTSQKDALKRVIERL